MTHCREYGNPPYRAIIVHGGPGAPGCCAAICRGLSDSFGVLEHLQEKNTIQELVEEIHDILARYGLEKTVLIGHSWGAWLSYLFAAKYPQLVSKLILRAHTTQIYLVKRWRTWYTVTIQKKQSRSVFNARLFIFLAFVICPSQSSAFLKAYRLLCVAWTVLPSLTTVTSPSPVT